MSTGNTSFTLEDLLMTIDKQASESEKDEGKKDDKKDEKKENPFSKKDEESEEVENGDKSSKEEKKEGQEKSASDAGAALAKEVFEKVALQKTTNKENEMNKQASVAGKALADAILTKLASAGDVITENGVTPGTVPTKITADNAQMMAQDDAKIQAVPGTDGAGNGGSVNQIFDSIVADAMSEGATEYNQANASAGEGKAQDQGTTTEPHADNSQEKMAALAEWVSQGIDFDTALSMLKEAEYMIEVEEDAQIKQAAVSELVGQGFDFDTAVDLIKEAGKAEAAKAAVGKVVSKVTAAAKGAVAGAKGTADAIKAEGAGAYAKRYGQNALAHVKANKGAYAGGAAALGAGAVAMHKKAAFEALVDAGVDFEKAAELVAAKSKELYNM